MREFNEADKDKKQKRIRLPENPGNLSPERLARLEETVKASLKSGYLPCAAAFKIAENLGAPKTAVGAMTDKLGVRVSNCRIGCFKVDKASHDSLAGKKADEKITAALESLKEKGELTCENVYALAQQMKTTPMAIAENADIRGWKIRQCQLGCF
jgi:hypothetical protein